MSATPLLLRDRRDAGLQLAVALTGYAGRSDLVVLGLPRGGVPVAYEVALALNSPLDVFIVRKLGVPGHEELAMGAIASGGIQVLNRDVVESLRIPPAVIASVAERETVELARRERQYREGLEALAVADRTVILVDDGVATGSTMTAAIDGLRTLHPRQIVVAVPVASVQAADTLRPLADVFVALETPQPFFGVGQWYANFAQTSDQEVRDLLAAARHRTATSPRWGDASIPLVPQ